MAAIHSELPQKVEPTYVRGSLSPFGVSPVKVFLERPNAHLEQRYQDLVIQHQTLLQAALTKEHIAPPPGLSPPGVHHEAAVVLNKKRSNSVSSCGSSTMASTRSRSCSVCSLSDDEGKDQNTSLTLRNIPTAFTRKSLVQLLDKHGLQGEYNMIYLPMDRFRKKARGFAFVNFERHGGAQRCMSIFEGFQNWGTLSTKVCTVEWGERKGDLQSQVLAYGNGAILRTDVPEEFKPALFRGGLQVPYSAGFF